MNTTSFSDSTVFVKKVKVAGIFMLLNSLLLL